MKYFFNSKPVYLNQEKNTKPQHKNKKNMSSLESKNLFFQNLLDQLPQLVWVKVNQNSYYYNQAICNYIGEEINFYEVNFWQEFLHPEDFEHFIVLWQHTLQSQQNFEKECRIKHVKKGYRYCLISVQHSSNHLNPFEWMITATDIHDYSLKQSELNQTIELQNQHLFQNLVQNVAPIKQTITPRLKPQNLKSSCLNSAMSEQNADTHLTHSRDPIFSPVLNKEGLIQNILNIYPYPNEQKIIEKEFQQVIEWDELTGLYNRHGFNKILKRTIQKARELKQSVGFLLIDLDHFKHVNDTLGHIAGDYLLQILGRRFDHCFQDEVIVSRLGGDEFAIIVPNLSDKNTLINIAKTARLQLNIPICYSGQYINGGMSIGCAIYPQDAQNSSNLLRCADIALNDLKISGRGGIRVFKTAMFKAIEMTTKQLSLAREIIHNNKILPFYQPKVNLQTGQVIGFEALLRWYDAEAKIQLPAHIFSAFQDYELATRISATMQLKIFKDMTQWLEMGMQLLPISINAAPVEFLRDNYAETLLNRLAQFDIPFSMIEIEITEQSLSERGSDYVIRALNMLKKSGISIALDDFGTGHSSLTRLRNYPVNCIKIDRKFIENIEHDPSAIAIVKAISQIGASISLDILVEGIEDLAQLEAVKACGCDLGQGFYFYRAMAMQDATQLLKKTDEFL